MEESLRDFEVEIVKNFKTFSAIEGGGRSRPRKGVWIRGHLLNVHEDYIYSMFKRWQLFTAEAWRRGAKIDTGTYGAFKTYTWLLKKYGLILLTRTERGRSTEFMRHYYTYNPDLLDDPRWENPYGEFPSWKAWKKKGFPHKK